eukprot:scaffold84602_cov75-Phaeocystis_antarctica.AAC.4
MAAAAVVSPASASPSATSSAAVLMMAPFTAPAPARTAAAAKSSVPIASATKSIAPLISPSPAKWATPPTALARLTKSARSARGAERISGSPHQCTSASLYQRVWLSLKRTLYGVPEWSSSMIQASWPPW